MCLSGKKYYINLHSSDATDQNKVGEFHHRFPFNWNSFLRSIPNDVEYFLVKVNFSLKATHGLDTGCLSIVSDQITSPFIQTFPNNIENPIALAYASNVGDVDISTDEKLSVVTFRSDASTQDGLVCSVKRDAFLDIKIQDPSGDKSATSVIGKYAEANGTPAFLNQFHIQLVLEPYLENEHH